MRKVVGVRVEEVTESGRLEGGGEEAYSTVQYSTVHYSTIQHSTVLYDHNVAAGLILTSRF